MEDNRTAKPSWEVGVTTAPRWKETLSRTLASIKSAGWEDLRVYADGDCPVPSPYQTTRRAPPAGAFSNWWLALQEMIQRNPEAKYYVLFQDDVVLAQGVKQRIESLNLDGVISLYQSSHHTSHQIQRFENGRSFVGALALVMTNDAAHRLAASDMGISHRKRQERNNDYIDGALGRWCREAGVPLWIHGPSLAQHIGEHSTLGHDEKPAATFIGEDADASALPLPHILPAGEPRKAKVGLVGFNTAQGLGYVNRDIAKFFAIDKWLIVPHSRFPLLDMAPGVASEIAGPSYSESQIRQWLQGLDAVIFVETIDIPPLPRIARQMGIKVVCIPMVEWIPTEREWTQYVDLWVAPTLFSYNQLLMRGVRGEIKHCPWPIDVSAFPFKQRKVCERFVYVHGNGGPRDRKGGKIVAEAAKLVPHIPLIVYSQTQNGMTSSLSERIYWPSHIDFRGATKSPTDLYADGDVFILPSRWEGLGLQLFECQAAGMPLITTDAPPMNESNPWRRLPCEPKRVRLSHDYASFNVAPADLAKAMTESLGQDITDASRQAREWVVRNRDWSSRATKIKELILGK